MQVESRSDNLIDTFLHLGHEPSLGHMLRHNALIDCLQGFHSGEAHSKHAKVALESRVDGEAASSGVHAGNILHIVDLLEGEFGPVIPVLVVQVLADECVGLHGAIGVHLRHVHVVNEVNQLFGARRTIVAA